MGTQMWEHFHHQADIGIRGTGKTVEQAFEQAAVALMAVMCSPDRVRPQKKIAIHCQAPDIELLFIDWLNALIYEADTRKMLFCRFEVTIDNDTLQAKAWGEKAAPQKHLTAVEVKAATYMMLSVKQNDNAEWLAQCVVDV